MRSEASRSGYKAVLLPVPKLTSSSPLSYIHKQTLQVRSDQLHHNEISRGLSTPVLLLSTLILHIQHLKPHKRKSQKPRCLSRRFLVAYFLLFSDIFLFSTFESGLTSNPAQPSTPPAIRLTLLVMTTADEKH
jgi:hypothetical protein